VTRRGWHVRTIKDQVIKPLSLPATIVAAANHGEFLVLYIFGFF